MDTDEISSSTADEAVVDSGGRRHTVWVYLLIVLGAVILLVTTVNVWVDRAALNTDNWVDASDELLADPEVRTAVSTYVVDQLYANVDVAEQLNSLLPGDFSRLAGVLAASLQGPATEAVDRLLSTPQAAEVWSQANRRAHETIVNILENETVPAVDTANGTVTLDLRQVVIRLGETLGLPSTVIDKIPESVGKVTVVESQKLENLQTAVAVVQWASVLLFILILVIYAGAIALAKGWRREATRSVGVSVFVVGLLVVAGLRFGGNILLDSVVQKEQNRDVAEAVWRIGSELLRDIGVALVVIGLLLVVGCGARRTEPGGEGDPSLHRAGVRGRRRAQVGHLGRCVPRPRPVGAAAHLGHVVRRPRRRRHRGRLRRRPAPIVPRRPRCSGRGRHGRPRDRRRTGDVDA